MASEKLITDHINPEAFHCYCTLFSDAVCFVMQHGMDTLSAMLHHVDTFRMSSTLIYFLLAHKALRCCSLSQLGLPSVLTVSLACSTSWMTTSSLAT